MLARLKAMLFDREGAEGASETNALHLAAAALLVESAVMDGEFDADERATVRRLMREQFDLSPDDAEELVAEAEAEVADASQLYAFTRTLNERFDAERKAAVIEMLWQVAYADGELHDYEASLVRRVAGLLHVPDRDSGLARKRALARLGLDVDEE